jgi:hypothetical protein
VSRFHIAIEKPDEIKPRLAKQELHWKEGRSAFELSTAWMHAGGIPSSVRAVLDQAPEWRDAAFREGIFERETGLPGKGRPSQTDLLAILELKSGNAILGVEGKVDEPFGPVVADWLADAKDRNRQTRLDGLCATLAVDTKTVGRLFYQLVHRTCASIYEAKRFGYSRAVILVHSFAKVPVISASPAGFDDFSKFACSVGMPVTHPGSISPPKLCEGIEVRLAWVSEKIAPSSRTL